MKVASGVVPGKWMLALIGAIALLGSPVGEALAQQTKLLTVKVARPAQKAASADTVMVDENGRIVFKVTDRGGEGAGQKDCKSDEEKSCENDDEVSLDPRDEKFKSPFRMTMLRPVNLLECRP